MDSRSALSPTPPQRAATCGVPLSFTGNTVEMVLRRMSRRDVERFRVVSPRVEFLAVGSLTISRFGVVPLVSLIEGHIPIRRRHDDSRAVVILKKLLRHRRDRDEHG